MDRKGEGLGVVERDGKEDELGVIKENMKEEELGVVETDIEEDEVGVVESDTKEKEPSDLETNTKKEFSIVKSDPKEVEPSVLESDIKEDESSDFQTEPKPDKLSILDLDEKEDELPVAERHTKEDEPSVVERDMKEDEIGAFGTDTKRDELGVVERVPEEGRPSVLETHTKEVGLSSLETDAKEDELSALEINIKEADLSVVERDQNVGELSILEKDTKDSEPSALETNTKKDKPSAAERDLKEDRTIVLETYTKEDELSSLETDRKEDELSALELNIKDDDLSVVKRDQKEDELSVSERDTKDNEPTSLEKSTIEDESIASEAGIKEDELGVLKRDLKEDELSDFERDRTESNLGVDTKEDDVIVNKMDMKEDTEAEEDHPSSSHEVLQQFSEEAVRVAGEELQSVCSSSASLPPGGPGHRRCRSEIGTLGHKRGGSFQKLRTQVQKAWRWGSNSREEGGPPSFNPEVLANQKRQWYQLHSKTMDHTKYKEPTSLFEHFIIVGLHPEANLEAVEEAFAKRKKWEMQMARSEMIDFKMLQHRGPSLPMLEPQILFKYPPGKKLAVRSKDLAAFCFPGGVKAWLLERTPSLSDLNELVYGQEHLGKDDSSFIFSLKVADNATLYGVCLHVSEIVQRPPGILSASSPLTQSSRGCSRFLVSAPRCYCLLTRVPFFELHFEMLNSIIAQERLNRITHFVSELSTSVYSPSISKLHDQMNGNADSPDREYFDDWTASAIPVDRALALTAAAAGITLDDEIPSFSQRTPEPRSPDSLTASDSSDVGHSRELDRDVRKSSNYFDDNSSEVSENRSGPSDRAYASYESCQASPEIGTFFSSRSRKLERIGSSDSLLVSPARSIASEDEDDELFANNEKDFGDDLIMEWARENKIDLLQIVCGYHALPLPPRGCEIVFQPLEHLQAIEYIRPPVSALGFSEEYVDLFETSEVKVKLAAAEEALALSIWTTATICRVLSLESILALLAGVLLEKQVVVVCPNLGVLSATVLSLVPMICPFQWQSLLLPVLPGRMLEFLDAPVPFIVGIQNKPADLKIKSSSVVQVNVLKDQVKMYYLPALPRYKELISQLRPIHARLSCESSTAKRHPVYRCNEVQAEAAMQFLDAMRHYLESICSDLRSHTITSVQSNNDRVSLLLKDSFIDSFPIRDRAFIKLFVDTQLFTVLSDSRLSSFENEPF